VRGKLSILGVALVALGVAGCGDIDAGELEDSIRSGLEQELQSQGGGGGVTVESVDCPDGEKSETGNTFECTAEASDGSSATIEAEVTDGDNGDVSWNVVDTSS
jgi:hypothetical protein